MTLRNRQEIAKAEHRESINAKAVVIDDVYSIAVDEFSETITYVGTAIAGSAYSNPVWQIKKIETSGTQTLIKFADGNVLFDNIWNNRTSLSYS